MAEPKWIAKFLVVYIHDDQIAQHGGSYGILNANLLASALARLRNLYGYERVTSLTQLAASYGYGLVKNHSFIDGKKRTAFQVRFVFLQINGLHLDAPEPERSYNYARISSRENYPRKTCCLVGKICSRSMISTATS